MTEAGERTGSGEPSAANTLAEALRRRVLLTPQAEAYRQYDSAAGRWQSLTWAEFGRRVGRWRRALEKEAFAPGARVAILVPNSIEHACMDQASLALGLVPVPLHATDNPESIAYILGDSGASLLLVDAPSRWAELAPLRSRFPELRRVLALRPPTAQQSELDCTPIDAWLTAAGAERPDDPQPQPPSGLAADPDALAALVYTSGTTGRPKGVMLSQRNVTSNVRALLELVQIDGSDLFLSFLPLSHSFERTCGYYLPIAAGACVAYARSVQALPEDLVNVRPTILISVPRIYERVHAKLQAQLAEAGRARTALFAAAQAVGWQRFCAEQGRGPGPGLLGPLAWPLLRRLVAERLLARFGGRLRFAISGGAPLSESISRCFLGLGLTLLQGFGMTESAPVVSANVPDDNEPTSVGRPLRGVQVRLGENDELLVRGPNVMVGYWRRPEDSARALEPDGWLHTGDQARIDESGRIYIKGRIKDIIVTSTGEKIAPADMELAICADPLFPQALVSGEGKPYLVALLVLDPDLWRREAPALGLDPADPEALRSAAAHQFALNRVRSAVSSFPAYATPRAVWLTLEPWTIEACLITPTLKLKRNALHERFAEPLRALYRGH